MPILVWRVFLLYYVFFLLYYTVLWYVYDPVALKISAKQFRRSPTSWGILAASSTASAAAAELHVKKQQ